MSWTQRIKHPSEMFQRVTKSKRWSSTSTPPTVKSRRFRSASKQLNRTRGTSFPTSTRSDRLFPPRSRRCLDFGAFVELDKGVEGLVHVSEISDDRVEDPRTVLKPGQEVNVEVISLDPQERKIGL